MLKLRFVIGTNAHAFASRNDHFFTNSQHPVLNCSIARRRSLFRIPVVFAAVKKKNLIVIESREKKVWHLEFKLYMFSSSTTLIILGCILGVRVRRWKFLTKNIKARASVWGNAWRMSFIRELVTGHARFLYAFRGAWRQGLLENDVM